MASTAAVCHLHEAAGVVFPVEEVECRKTDVGHFLFAKNEALIGCGVQRLRNVRGRKGGCGCASHQRKPQSSSAALDGRKKGATPRWVGYVAVEDVDGVVDRLKRLGGTVYVPPTDTNIGRFAVVADPQTATLALVKGLKYGDPNAEPGGLGRVCWHELFAADAKAAFEFYRTLLGWQKADPWLCR